MKKGIRKIAAVMAMGAMLAITPVLSLAEEVQVEAVDNAQKLDTYYNLALNAINAEDYEKAGKYLNVCFAYCNPTTNPDIYSDLMLKRACIDVINGDDDIALAELDGTISLSPELADAYLVRTQVFTNLGRYEEAAADLEKYIELTGVNDLYETVAELYEANGDMDKAEEAYMKYAQAGEETLPEAVYQSALYKMQGGKLDEAIEAFMTYENDETYGAGAMYNIGVCRMNQEDYEAAKTAFQTSLDKGSVFTGVYYNLGICEMMLGEWEASAGHFELSIESEPFVDDARYNFAIAKMQLGELETAVDAFTELIGDGEQEITEEPTGEDGEITEEETAGEEETEADEPEEEKAVNYAAYYFRGACYAALGSLDKALADYTVCIDNEYDLANSYYQRAQVYAALEDTDHQTEDLENSLKYQE